MFVVHKFNHIICHKYRLEEVEIIWSLKKTEIQCIGEQQQFYKQ